MPSTTANYQLNQWEPEDNFLRTDFNADNAKIDAALTALAAGQCQFACGSYTGSGSSTGREINVGFHPKAVLLCPQQGLYSNSYAVYGGLILRGYPLLPGGYASGSEPTAAEITENGFKVYYHANSNQYTDVTSMVYHYIAVTW